MDDTRKLAALLMKDTCDLIHEAAGWMLLEAGMRDEVALLAFIQGHDRQMPRAMLRYAIQRFPAAQRQALLKGAI
jgi:3-methyladenine DNA glycosylase AlkD